MNEQIKNDKELLAKWHFGKNLMGRIVSMSAEDGDALLAAQARFTESRVRKDTLEEVIKIIHEMVGIGTLYPLVIDYISRSELLTKLQSLTNKQ